jgi:hypothetical protein
MIPVSDLVAGALRGSFRYYVNVQSWYGATLLADGIPVSSGTEEDDRSLNVPERVTISVPRRTGRTDWSPTKVDSPLAANGQRLRVQLGIGTTGGTIEWLQRGWYLIEDSETQEDIVNVNAVGLLALVQEARLVTPYQPTGTLASSLRSLTEPALTVAIDDSLTDRAVPGAINFDDDRLQCVNEILDAWPAEGKMDPNGFFLVSQQSTSTTPLLLITDGEEATFDGTVYRTVVRADGTSTRDGAYNVVVARGTASDGGQVQGVAYDRSGGAHDVSGLFNTLLVPYFFDSPLLTSVNECNQAAMTTLARLQRNGGRSFTVTMVPNPTLQTGDVIAVTTDEVTGLVCTIESLKLPYKPGTMTLNIKEVLS